MQHPRPSVSDNRKDALLLVVAVALIARMVVLALFQSSSMRLGIWSDAETYNQWARRIVSSGDWIGHDPFFMTPFYPYFLAAIYSFAGPNALVVRLVQLVAGTATAAGLFLIGERLVSRRAGLVAGLLAAVYGPFLLSGNLLLVETMKVFFLVWAFLLLLAAREHRSAGMWLGAGLILGLAVLCRPTDLITVFVAIAWIILAARDAGGKRFREAALVLAGVALVVAPVTVRTWAVEKEFVLITSNGGLNFFLGNNPDAVGVYYNVDRLDLATDPDGRVFAESILQRPVTPSEASSYYLARAFTFIRTQPALFIGLQFRKALLFFHYKEISQLGYNYRFIAETAVPLLAYVPTFLVVGPLALIGCVAFARQRRALALLYGFLLAQFLAVILFFVTDRFRLSAVPFMIVFAGAALDRILIWWQGKRWRALGGASLGLLSGVVLATVGNVGIQDDYSLEYEYVGLMHFDARDYGRAMDAYRQSLRHRDTFHGHNNIGNVFLAQGNVNAALAEYAKGEALNPRQAISPFSIGTAYVSQRDWRAALAMFDKALAINPRFAPAHLNRGLTLYYLGDYRGALTSLERYCELERDPTKTGSVRRDIENLRLLVRQQKPDGGPASR